MNNSLWLRPVLCAGCARMVIDISTWLYTNCIETSVVWQPVKNVSSSHEIIVDYSECGRGVTTKSRARLQLPQLKPFPPGTENRYDFGEPEISRRHEDEFRSRIRAVACSFLTLTASRIGCGEARSTISTSRSLHLSAILFSRVLQRDETTIRQITSMRLFFF